MSRASRRRVAATISLSIGCVTVLAACQPAMDDQPTATPSTVLDSCAQTTMNALNGLANDVNAGDAQSASRRFAPEPEFLHFGDFPNRWFDGRPQDRESLDDYLQTYVDDQTILTLDVVYTELGHFGLTFSLEGRDGTTTAGGVGYIDCDTGHILTLVFGMTEAEVAVGYDPYTSSTTSSNP